ncbi:Uncharacterized protein FKW44_021401 [Caligus rogercresseyi]|uniref:Uncharacterized protein n=1 Tax=Caligus rogercresseyi TaxID=217165 RepID=A0A7T8GRE3_CALRO|nr:Uncharacterized protein FKW44_021401 [Caligus rogercresseyi]
MDWMYDGNKSEVNKEEYLLGKAVDKNFEGTLGQINAVEYDCTPASIFSSSAIIKWTLSGKSWRIP